MNVGLLVFLALTAMVAGLVVFGLWRNARQWRELARWFQGRALTVAPGSSSGPSGRRASCRGLPSPSRPFGSSRRRRSTSRARTTTRGSVRRSAPAWRARMFGSRGRLLAHQAAIREVCVDHDEAVCVLENTVSAPALLDFAVETVIAISLHR